MSSENLQELDVSPNKVIDATISVQTENTRARTDAQLSGKIRFN